MARLFIAKEYSRARCRRVHCKAYGGKATCVWKSVAAQRQFSLKRHKFRSHFEQSAVQMNIIRATRAGNGTLAILF
jgi:hypothetical protein